MKVTLAKQFGKHKKGAKVEANATLLAHLKKGGFIKKEAKK